MTTMRLGYIAAHVDQPVPMILSVASLDLLRKRRVIFFEKDKFFVYELILLSDNVFYLHMFEHGITIDESNIAPHLQLQRLRLIKVYDAASAEILSES